MSSSIKCAIVASCLLLLQFFVAEVDSFVITFPSISTKQQQQFQMSDLDYEYLPPNADAPAPPLQKLKSSYPPETPAGLRGEAVRSALRSTRCIAWQLLSNHFLEVKGKGTMDFLSNKLSQLFGTTTFTQACLLNPKGRLVDLIAVATLSPNCAYLIGHDAQALFEQLHPLIFPMDQVKLKLVPTNMFSVASMDLKHVKVALQNYMVPLLERKEKFEFPSSNQQQCVHYELPSGCGTLTILPSVNLPDCACRGYTLVFSNSEVASQIWNNLIGEDSPEGPVEIGALEYETLRIQAGQPAYGKEMTAGLSKKKDDDKSTVVVPPANPLELHLEDYVNMEKGCYLGQEGIASVFKNPRGPPRLLYSVEFDDDQNIYQHQSSSSDKIPNLTTIPRAGQDLYVLGSNETIAVGKLTSVAEPGGTGDANIVAMALVRRADSVLKQMRDSQIEMPSRITPENNNGGMIQPPPMDPLDGLEVIVGGTYTIGTLKSIPSRRLPRGQNMFTIPDNNLDNEDMAGSVMGYRFVNDNTVEEVSVISSRKEEPSESAQNVVVLDNEEDELDKMQQEAAKAEAEAKAAAAEAKRKAEKMEMLRKRAEEAMARRKKKQQKK